MEKKWWQSDFWGQPLVPILVVALALRLAAAWFSEGYLMHDDHFLVLEAAASWADGEDYNNWFPWSQEKEGLPVGPHPANFAYVGTQFVVICGLKSLGISNPKTIAFVLRLFHAVYSLLAVWLVYRIAEKLGSRRAAWTAGWGMAAFAVVPVLSVHQLVEMACIPPLLLAVERALCGKSNWHNALWIGLGFGLATGFRFQCGLMALGWAAGTLWKARCSTSALRKVLMTGAFSLAFFSLSQIQDVFIWGRPFVQLMAYFGYNTTHALNYPQGPPGQFLLTLIGLMVPPLSLALIWGMLKEIKRWPEWVGAVLVFWLFHELYPNKQERFILPALPLILALGASGWARFEETSVFWGRRQRLRKGLLFFALALNSVALGILTFGQAKSSRVNAMYALWEAGDLNNFMAVYVDSSPQVPAFYSGSWDHYYVAEANDKPAERLDLVCRMKKHRTFPNYLLFYGDEHLGEAVQAYKSSWPGLTYVSQIAPSRLDRIIHWLNPLNSVERVMIYRVEEEVACANTKKPPAVIE